MVSEHLILLLLITEVRILTIPGTGQDLAQAEDCDSPKVLFKVEGRTLRQWK